MVSEPNKYGVAWKTTKSSTSTSVWFKTRGERGNYTVNLINNPIVKEDSITFYKKNDAGKIMKEKRK